MVFMDRLPGDLLLNLEQLQIDNDEELPDALELSTSLIVTGADLSVFDDIHARHIFEYKFRQFDPDAEFHYLKSFRRARINFTSPDRAEYARMDMHNTEICGKVIKCFFAQPIKMKCNYSGLLEPPPIEKQFLISPPASPPVGWEQRQESHPIINYELVSAIAHLTPGEIELHPPSDQHPAIVVHVCEDLFEGPRPRIVQTRCPERD